MIPKVMGLTPADSATGEQNRSKDNRGRNIINKAANDQQENVDDKHQNNTVICNAENSVRQHLRNTLKCKHIGKHLRKAHQVKRHTANTNGIFHCLDYALEIEIAIKKQLTIRQ